MVASQTSREKSPPDGLHSRLPNWCWDIIAVFAVLSFSFMPGPRPPAFHPIFPAFIVVPVLLVCVFLPFRRRWPIAVFTACTITYCITVFISFSSVGVGIAASIAAFGMASHTLRRTAFAIGAAGAIVVAILSFTTTEWGVVDPRVFQVSAGIAVATALGDSSRSRREYMIAVTERARRAEETREAESLRRVAEERLRIARDLHDTVAHRISVISLNAGIAVNTLDTSPEKTQKALTTIHTAASEVLGEIGNLLQYLRTSSASDKVEAPQVGLAHLDNLIMQMNTTGLQVNLLVEGDISAVTGATDLVAYRIIQEGLTNAHKHGSNNTAEVVVSVTDDVFVSITNPIADGEENHPQAPGERLGLVGVRERVASVRGSVTINRLHDGFQLTAHLPIPTKGNL